MYDRLQLGQPADDNESPPFPLLRGHTMITQSRPRTYSIRKANKSARPFSIRSAPAFMFKENSNLTDNFLADLNEHEHIMTNIPREMSATTDFDYNEYGQPRQRGRLDPDQLCEHLQSHGFGLPKIVHTGSIYQRPSQGVPKKFKSRPLPKNPSKREKIKGRARLDQEMANMKAQAFCEQQSQTKAFRTASANMRNRDVLLMEEELREDIAREHDFLIDDDDDDKASIVRMPVKQEELIMRVNTWVMEVQESCRVYKHPNEIQQEAR